MFVPCTHLLILAAIAACNVVAAASVAGGCPPLTSDTLDVYCSLAGDAVDCKSTVPVGTTASLGCRPGFKPPEVYTGIPIAQCTIKKNWSRRLFDCIPDCGRRKSEDTRAWARTVGGQEAGGSEFPWHVAIFLEHRNSFLAVCGGSLVTPTFVVTAAHCFWNEIYQKPMNRTMYRVATGKHTAAWDTIDVDEQRFTIKAVHLPETFLGRTKKLDADVAVIKLSAAVTLTLDVNLICVDWRNLFDNQQLSHGNNGTVPGWGITESDQPSITLRKVELPFVSYADCHKSVPFDYQPFLTSDKICGGYTNRTTSVCQGDSGGGFVFPAQNLQGRRYFLRAVVSSQPGAQGVMGKKCSGNFRSAFTRISTYLPWVQSIVFAPQDDDNDDDDDGDNGDAAAEINERPTTTTTPADGCTEMTSGSLAVECIRLAGDEIGEMSFSTFVVQ